MITDAEEGGLQGASAFVKEHAWLGDIALVLNFEARGNGGPVVLMETSDENGWLIREFAKAAPYPIASSFAVDVYKLLPNDTDFTIFRAAGKAGLNFAFFKGLRFYHTDQDTIANLDERSLQHHGSYCLALARHFGNLSLEDVRAPDVVFFNWIGSHIAVYPLAWVEPIMFVVLLTTLAVLTIGLRRRRLTLSGTAGGLLVFVSILVVAPTAVMLTSWTVNRIPAVSGDMFNGDSANADIFAIGHTILSLAVFTLVHAWAGKRISIQNRTQGALVLWLALAVASSLLVPRGSYFFVWPVLFSAPGMLCLFPVEDSAPLPPLRLLVVAVATLPGILLMVPGGYLLSITAGTSLSAVPAVATVLLLGLLTPLVDQCLQPLRYAPAIVLGSL